MYKYVVRFKHSRYKYKYCVWIITEVAIYALQLFSLNHDILVAESSSINTTKDTHSGCARFH